MEITESKNINGARISDHSSVDTPDTHSLRERSDVVEEIISRKSDFFEKWALSIFFFLLLIVGMGTWFIKYPDIVTGQATLTGENTPKEVIAQQSGKLVRFFAHTNQTVKEGEIIGWIESNADVNEVLNLSDKLSTCIHIKVTADTDTEIAASLFDNHYSNLGELQIPYQQFINAWQQYKDYRINGFYTKRRQLLQNDAASLNNVIHHSTFQKSLIEKENNLARKSYEMNETLFKEKVISAEEFRQAQGRMLSNEKALPQLDINIAYQQSQLRDKQKEIDQLTHDTQQQQIIFEQSLFTFKSTVDDWLRKFTIRAPANGQLMLILPLQPNQYIDQNKLLGYVNPDNTRYYAEVRMSQHNFGKVSAGLKVQLRLDAYPYQEMGFLKGTLNYISKVAVDSGFIGTITLDSGLITNQHKAIQFKSGLKGQALIITKDMRLLERLYYSVVKSTSFNN